MKQKRCTQCAQVKNLDEFVKARGRKDGHKSYCRQCHAAKMRERREECPEREREVKRRYYRNHAGKVKERARQYYQANAGRMRATQKAYRKRNGESLSQSKSVWQKRHYGENKRLYQERNHRWAAANPDKVAAKKARRKARKADNGGSFTAVEWRDLKARYARRCLCCGCQEPEIKLTVDHVMPLSAGGSSDIDNIQPLCKSCNSVKGTSTIDYRGGATSS